MRQIVGFLFFVIFLSVAIATGAFLLIALALIMTGVFLVMVIRQKITGKPVGFTQFYHYREQRTQADDTTVIDAEYKEIKSEKRLD